MAQALRLFVAVPMPERVTALLAQVQGRLRTMELPVRWVKPGNIHLTLKFLGDLPATVLSAVTAQMDAAAGAAAPFTLHADGVGMFPHPGRARVLWVGLAGDLGPLATLQEALDRALESLGLARETRSFQAHLTIGRARQPVDLRPLAGSLAAVETFSSEPFTVNRLNLYRSVLKPGGAEYTLLHGSRLAC